MMIHHVQLASPAGSEERSRRFFVDRIGLTEVAKPAALAGRGGCWFTGPGVAVHIGTEAGFRPARKAHPAIKVPDLDRLHAELTDVAATTAIDDTELPGHRRFYTCDPHGNRLEFLAELPHRWTLGEGCIVRRATVADVAAIVSLLRDDVLGSSREADDPDLYAEAFLEIDADPRQFLAVVEDPSGSVIGTCQLTFTTTLSRQAATRMSIEAVRVANAVRGSGVGKRLITWALDQGVQRGATLAQLTTDRTREDAHRFYRSLGFNDTHHGMKLALPPS
ncbi:GNAT family N-acetyltransferase [Naumannella halotolerans]|uniref:GNAT family N-acetyltransferase n=1 Tax=Naumannella halotolerans TaxID=993414 RepID=UPI00370D1F5C